MQKRIALFAVVLSIMLSGTISERVWAQTSSKPAWDESESLARYTEWVGRSLTRIETVKVGMTRADLLKTFTTEGGLYTGVQRTYVYRDCPYFKVDVEFEPAGRPLRDAGGRVTLVESGSDVITKNSRPYLDWSIND